MIKSFVFLKSKKNRSALRILSTKKEMEKIEK